MCRKRSTSHSPCRNPSSVKRAPGVEPAVRTESGESVDTATAVTNHSAGTCRCECDTDIRDPHPSLQRGVPQRSTAHSILLSLRQPLCVSVGLLVWGLGPNYTVIPGVRERVL